MEFLLLIIAGIVVYYLYISLQDYLKNPIKTKDPDSRTQKEEKFQDPYRMLEPQDSMSKYLSTELGAMQSLILAIPSVKTNYLVCMAHCLGDWYRVHYIGFDFLKEQDQLLKEQANNLDYQTSIQSLSQATYAEYKKRLNFVGLILVMMYMDGRLDEKEREFLIDVAAQLSLENPDFNALYDEFEASFKDIDTSNPSSPEEKTQENETSKDSNQVQKIFKENLFDIFDYKNQNKKLSNCAVELFKILKDFK